MAAATLKMLKKPTMTGEQLQGNLGEVETSLAAGPEFDFRMKVPYGWAAAIQADAAPEKGGPPVLLLHVSPEDSLDIELRVYVVVLEREMNPQDWFEIWLQHTEQGMISARNFKTSYGLLADALTHGLDMKVPGTRRYMTVKDGDRLFLIEATSRSDMEQPVHLMQNLFLVASGTFELLKPTKERFAEPFKIEALAGDGPLPYFLIPESWTVVPQSETPPGGDALLFDNDSAGTIMIVAMPEEDQEDMLEEVLYGKFSAPEAGLDNMTELRDTQVVVPNKTLQISARGSDAVKGDMALNFMVAKIKGPKLSAACAFMTPDEDTSLEAYAINRRAYEVMLESLELTS